MAVEKTEAKDLKTYASNTWCPGCGNFAILNSVRKVFSEFDTGKLVMVSGIGCHGKIVDYVNVNSFYSIHGRVPATATGIKLANPELTVVGFAGDGDAYGEGLLHLIFAAKRNVDITIIVHNNERVYEIDEAGGREEAEEKIKEWDYNSDTKIPIGIFYREERETYDDSMLRGLNPSKREKRVDVASFLQKVI